MGLELAEADDIGIGLTLFGLEFDDEAEADDDEVGAKSDLR